MRLADQEIASLKKKITEFLSQKPEILFAFLFGSLARGEGTSLSDIDVAIYVDEAFLRRKDGLPGVDPRSGIISQLIGVLKSNEVDLVLLNDASPLLRHRILTQGESLVVRAPLEEQRFFIRTMKEYFDTEPVRKVQMKYLRDYLHELNPRKN